jgi:hypothetical protein
MDTPQPVTNCMQRTPPSVDSQDIPRILRKLERSLLCSQQPATSPILGQISTVHAPPILFLQYLFHIVPPSTPRSFK